MADTEPEQILVALAGIFILGIGGQWLAWRVKLPSILMLLALGIAVGPASGLLSPDKLFGDLLLPAVSLAVGVILFEGSLGLKVTDLRAIGAPLVGLLTLGALITWCLAAAAARYLLGFGPANALLLGAILVVTGPTVIGPLLQHIRPLGKVGPIARWEGIVIDPLGAVLAVLVFEAKAAVRESALQQATMTAVWGLLQTVLIGAVIGVSLAWLLVQLLRRHWIPDQLQSPVALMMVMGAFAASNLLQHESGLLTVTLMGVMLANQRTVSIKHIVEFKENLSVLLISCLFILLASRLRFEDFLTLGWSGPAFAAFLIFVVRPVAVYASTLGSELTWQERAFLAWLAPRGIVAAAVASVFAFDSGPEGDPLVAATFLVITVTVSVYGLTSGRLARRLGLSKRDPQGVLIASAHAGARAIAVALRKAEIPVLLVDLNADNLRTARMEGLPTLYANILAESTTEQLDLGGIGRLLAMTSNDEVNSLAAEHYSELFGKSQVFRLAPRVQASQRRATAAGLLYGRTLFGKDVTYESLDQRFEQGEVVKTTPLTDKFDMQAFRAQYGEQALVLFVLGPSGRLDIATADRPLTPRSGERVVALVEPLRAEVSSLEK